MVSYTVSISSKMSCIASITTGFNILANESGSLGSSSFNTNVDSAFSAVICFRGCPCSTNLEMEKPLAAGALDSFEALLYSSRMRWSSLRTVLPTVCSKHEERGDRQK